MNPFIRWQSFKTNWRMSYLQCVLCLVLIVTRPQLVESFLLLRACIAKNQISNYASTLLIRLKSKVTIHFPKFFKKQENTSQKIKKLICFITNKLKISLSEFKTKDVSYLCHILIRQSQ